MLRQRVGSVLVFHNNVMHGSEGFERGQSDMPACLPASCMLSLPFSKCVSALTLPACPPAYMRAQLMIYIILVCQHRAARPMVNRPTLWPCLSAI